MAAPSFVQASTGATDATGAFSFTGSATGTIGDIVIVHVGIDGSGAISWGTISGTNIQSLAAVNNTWTEIGTFHSGAAVQQRLFIGRRTSSSSAPTFSASANTSGNDVYGRMYEFTNVSTGTTLATVIENSTAGGTTTSGVTSSDTASNAAVTTLGPDRLALNFVAVNDDNSISAFTGESGGNWVLPASPYADAGGTDGAIALQASYLFDVEVISFPSGTAGPENFGDATTLRRGQSFVAPSTASSWTVGVELDASGSPTDDVQLDLYADSSGPTGASLGSSAPLDVSGTGLKMYTPTISASLVSGTTYWIVASRTGAQNASNFYRWSRGTITYAGGSGADDTGTWAIGGNDMSFGISAGDTTGTIDGGTGSIVDIDSWGVVGFALIGTTVSGPATSFLLPNRNQLTIRR